LSLVKKCGITVWMYYSASAKWKAIILILSVLLLAGVIYGVVSLKARPVVPQKFSDTRGEAAQTAEGIVGLASESLANLEKVGAADKAGRYGEALDLVLQEVNRNREARDRAVVLSQQLGLMAGALYQVKPIEAAQLGVEAIGKEYQIVERLINYNGITYQLLDVLRAHYGSGTVGQGMDIHSRVDELIGKLNSDARAVNAINEEYKGLMASFDNLTK
jgi:hypothetical protein